MPDSKKNFVATASRYRPETFADILAQPGVTVTLKNALSQSRIHPAYLLCGPRGTGKTTTARVLAKALNCENLQQGDPCGTCAQCELYQSGRSMDIIEVDGASNRGVDDIRNLRERVAYAAVGGGYKVYIVDEVHMLTNEAFNALLKTLEEPPAKVAFIFATTEPARVPATILSRCQRFDFRRINETSIVGALQRVATSDALNIDQSALELLARRAQGSLRDAFSLLDQTVAYAEGNITRAEVEEALGVISEESLFEITGLWASRDTGKAFSFMNGQWEAGIDPGEWAHAYGEHLRNLLAARVGGDASPGPRFEQAVASFELGDLLRAQVMLSDMRMRLRLLNDPRPEVELFLLRLFTLADTVTLSEALKGNVAATRPRPERKPVPSSTSTNGDTQSTSPENLSSRDDDPAPSSRSSQSSAESEEGPTASTRSQGMSASPAARRADLPAEPWERFLVILRKKAPWAASELRNGRLDRQTDGRAEFFVPESNPFNQERFKSTGIRSAVEDALEVVYGGRPTVVFRFGESVKKNRDTKALVEDHPALAELLEATDGEIVARRPRKSER